MQGYVIASPAALNKKVFFLYGEEMESMLLDISRLKPSTSQPKISLGDFCTLSPTKVIIETF